MAVALPPSLLNKQWASVTTQQKSPSIIYLSLICSTQSPLLLIPGGWMDSTDWSALFPPLARDGCLGSGFSLRHNIAKQTDCGEISPDAEMYIIEPALIWLYAVTRIHRRPGFTYHARENAGVCMWVPPPGWGVIISLWVVTRVFSAHMISLKDERGRLDPHLAVTANCWTSMIAVITHGSIPQPQTQTNANAPALVCGTYKVTGFICASCSLTYLCFG